MPSGRGRCAFSLQAKIVLLVLLCVGIPLFSMGLYGLRLNRELLEDKVHENLTNQLFRKSTALGDWVKQAQADVRQLVHDQVRAGGRPEPGGQAGRADAARARTDTNEYLTRVMGFYHTYDSLFLVNLDGEVIASTREERLEENVKRLLAPHIDSEGSEPGLPLRVPGRPGHHGRLSLGRSARRET